MLLAESTLTDVASWVTIVAAPLTVLGLVLAWLQLRRTARATEEAQRAITRTARNLAVYQLLVLIPEMQRLEAELDLAVKANDEMKAIDVLNHWRKTGSEISGLLESRPDDRALVLALQTSFAAGLVAKGRLSRSAVREATSAFRSSMGGVTVELGALAGRLRANIGN